MFFYSFVACALLVHTPLPPAPPPLSLSQRASIRQVFRHFQLPRKNYEMRRLGAIVSSLFACCKFPKCAHFSVLSRAHSHTHTLTCIFIAACTCCIYAFHLIFSFSLALSVTCSAAFVTFCTPRDLLLNSLTHLLNFMRYI